MPLALFQVPLPGEAAEGLKLKGPVRSELEIRLDYTVGELSAILIGGERKTELRPGHSRQQQAPNDQNNPRRHQ